MPNGSLCVHKFIFSLRRGAVGSTLEGEKERTGLLSLDKTERGLNEELQECSHLSGPKEEIR